MKIARIIYSGPNRDGAPIVVIASVGGNRKTDSVVGLSVIPKYVYDAVRAAEQTMHGRGKAYHNSIGDHIQTACGKCIFGMEDSAARDRFGLKKCYAQKNYQNVLQASTIIGDVIEAPERMTGVLDRDGFAAVMAAAKLVGVTFVRSAIVGDLGMLPEAIAMAIVDMVEMVGGFRWLAYTHQWGRSDWLRSTHQASTQGPWKAAHAAKDRGWGVYHVISEHEEHTGEGFRLCPVQVGKLAGVDVTCSGCPIPCDGSGGHSTYAIDHGPGCNLKRSTAGKAADLDLFPLIVAA